MSNALFGHEVASTFLEVLNEEVTALEIVAQRLQNATEVVTEACDLLSLSDTCEHVAGRVIVSGVGKAGLVARKVSATLSSTGTAAAFMDAVDALHGDLGFVHTSDRALLFSYSGETVEIIRLARELQRIGCPLVVITRSQESTLGQMATVCIEIGEVREACYMGLAPSSSTTAMLAIGDALALAMAKAKGFGEEDFGRNHPAGSLGLRFRCVQELMRTGDKLVCVHSSTPLKQVIRAVSEAKTGAAILTHEDGTLCGIFTDGDLRRALLNGSAILEEAVAQFASIPCHCIPCDASIAEALKLFHKTHTEELPVTDRETGKVTGMLCLKDIAAF